MTLYRRRKKKKKLIKFSNKQTKNDLNFKNILKTNKQTHKIIHFAKYAGILIDFFFAKKK